MPSLELTKPTTNSCEYKVILSSPFDKNYYKELRITGDEKYKNKTSCNSIDNYVVSKKAPSSGGTKSVTGVINNGMSAGNKYNLYAFAQALNGIWYFAGTDDITMLNGQTSKTLSMPACHNQKYNVYHGYFNIYACGACSVAHVAEFYRGSAYSNNSLEADLKNAKVISDTNYGAVWGNCSYGKIATAKSVVSYSKLYELIKTEIDANRPVIIKQTGQKGRQHFVVAYKYTNGAISDTDIYVLDSANLTQGRTTKKNPDDPNDTIDVSTHPIGQYLTLEESASYNNCPTYSSYMTTSRS